MASATEEIRIGGLGIRYLVEGSSTGRALAMFELEVAPGAKVPVAHSHDAYDETAYGLEGILTMTLWDEVGEPTTREIGPGQAVFIPRGVVHRFDNLHSQPVRALCVLTPGILSPDYFREIAAVVRASMQSDPPAAPDPAAFAAIMRRHGLTAAPHATLPVHQRG